MAPHVHPLVGTKAKTRAVPVLALKVAIAKTELFFMTVSVSKGNNAHAKLAISSSPPDKFCHITA